MARVIVHAVLQCGEGHVTLGHTLLIIWLSIFNITWGEKLLRPYFGVVSIFKMLSHSDHLEILP